MDRGGQRGWSTLMCAAGVLVCAGVASANVGAAPELVFGAMSVVMLPVIMLIELLILRALGARFGSALVFVIVANLASYAVGLILSGTLWRQPLSSIPGGMEWWWAVPWLLLFAAFVLTILIEWPILRFSFVKEKRGRALGAVVLAHVATYTMLSLAFVFTASTSFATDLRVQHDPEALSRAGDAVLVFIDESGYVRQARASNPAVSLPVLIDGKEVKAPETATRRQQFMLRVEADEQAWIVEDSRSGREDSSFGFEIPVNLDRLPKFRSMLNGESADNPSDWLSFHDWRNEENQREWFASIVALWGAVVRTEDGWLKSYNYDVPPLYVVHFWVSQNLPGDIAICTIEEGYPVAIAWNEGWVMDLREVLGARSDVVVVYGEVGDGWPEEGDVSADE